MNESASINKKIELLKYDNIQIEVIVEGEGEPIVLLPSRGRDADDNDEIAYELAKQGYKVIRPQPRGIKGSKGPLDNITLKNFATDIANVIKYYSDEPVVIVGHAFGSWVTRATASYYPELCKGIVIVAAASKDYPPELSENVNKVSDLSLPDSVRLSYIQKTFFAHNHDASIWLDGWYREVSLSQRKAALATRKEDWWYGGDVPVLDLQAMDDPFRPSSSREAIRDELGDRVDIAVIENASHAVVVEQPKRVVEEILAWLKKLNEEK